MLTVVQRQKTKFGLQLQIRQAKHVLLFISLVVSMIFFVFLPPNIH